MKISSNFITKRLVVDAVMNDEEVIIIEDTEKEYKELNKMLGDVLTIKEGTEEGVYIGNKGNGSITINPFELNYNKDDNYNAMVFAKAGEGMSFINKNKVMRRGE